MRTDEDIEGYLIDLDVVFEQIGKGLWVIHPDERLVENIVIHHDEPILTIRVKVMPIPTRRREEFFERLLRLNRTEMVHGAYGLEDDAVVIIDTLQTPNLDLNELQASVDAMSMAVSSHMDKLSEYLESAPEAA